MAAIAIAAALPLFASYSAHAEADASAQISFTSLTIDPATGTVQMSSGTTSGSDTLNFVDTDSTAVSVPGQVAATGQGTGQAEVQGTFEIIGGSGMVNVNFLTAFNGALSAFTDNYGQSASTEAVLTLNVGGNTVLNNISQFSIGQSQKNDQSFSTTIQDTIPLNFNQQYAFILSSQAKVQTVNAPEPTPGMLLMGGLVGLCILRLFSGSAMLRRHPAPQRVDG